jgi:hypothetical protein
VAAKHYPILERQCAKLPPKKSGNHCEMKEVQGSHRTTARSGPGFLQLGVPHVCHVKLTVGLFPDMFVQPF